MGEYFTRTGWTRRHVTCDVAMRHAIEPIRHERIVTGLFERENLHRTEVPRLSPCVSGCSPAAEIVQV